MQPELDEICGITPEHIALSGELLLMRRELQQAILNRASSEFIEVGAEIATQCIQWRERVTQILGKTQCATDIFTQLLITMIQEFIFHKQYFITLIFLERIGPMFLSGIGEDASGLRDLIARIQRYIQEKPTIIFLEDISQRLYSFQTEMRILQNTLFQQKESSGDFRLIARLLFIFAYLKMCIPFLEERLRFSGVQERFPKITRATHILNQIGNGRESFLPIDAFLNALDRTISSILNSLRMR